MDYSVYNDYELLYLIEEGVEAALQLLYDKYSYLIYRTATVYYTKGEKLCDLLQVGRIVLLNCIHTYKKEYDCSFYSFFLLCLRRRYMRELMDDYYKEFLCLSNNSVDDYDYAKIKLFPPEQLFSKLEEQRIYKEVILEGLSLKAYAKKYEISYSKAYYRYLIILDKLSAIYK